MNGAIDRSVETLSRRLLVQPGLAKVTYRGYRGSREITERVINDDDVASFGSAKECQIRIAHFPARDHAVPPVAGRLVAAAGRLHVECAEGQGCRALEVVVDRGPIRFVPLGEGLSPRCDAFAVVVAGSDGRSWRLDVVVRRRAPLPGAETGLTEAEPVQLSADEVELLNEYAAPIRRGGLEPATHRQVAKALYVDYNTARSRLYRIGQRFFAADLPMPDVRDRRVAVVECARINGLVPGLEGARHGSHAS